MQAFRSQRERRGSPSVDTGTDSLSKVSILGVQIANASRHEAIAVIEQMLREPSRNTRPIYIVNAHTLNLASESTIYRCVLNAAHTVFSDGTGARWAARLRGVRIKANLVGTDLIPDLFRATAGRGYRYFLLGADTSTIQRAAQACQRMYPGWELAGFHHGYVQDEEAAVAAIDQIHAARRICCWWEWATPCRSNGSTGFVIASTCP